MIANRIRQLSQDFWEWFSISSNTFVELHDIGDSKEIARLIDTKLSAFNLDIGWEFGVDLSGSRYFALSPKMSSKILLITTGIVGYSPKIEGWKFYFAKPRRGYCQSIEFSNPLGQQITIDISNWQYSLRLYREDRQFDVTLFPDKIPLADEEAIYQIASTVVQGLLGEIVCIESVDQINISLHSGDEISDSLSSIQHLYEHIASLGIITIINK